MHTVLDDGAASVICLLLLAEGTCAVGHLQETSIVEARQVNSVIAGSVQGCVSVKFAFGLVLVMTSGAGCQSQYCHATVPEAYKDVSTHFSIELSTHAILSELQRFFHLLYNGNMLETAHSHLRARQNRHRIGLATISLSRRNVLKRQIPQY